MPSWLVWCWFALHGATADLMAFVYSTRFGTRCDGAASQIDPDTSTSAEWAEGVAPALVACAAAQCLMLAATAAVRLRGSTHVAAADSIGLCLTCGAAVATVLPCMILFAELATQPVFCSCGVAWAACDLARSVLCVASMCYRCGRDRSPTAVSPDDLGDRSGPMDANDGESTVAGRDEDDAVAAQVGASRLSRSTADSAKTSDTIDTAR